MLTADFFQLFEVVFHVDCAVCRAASHICTVCILMACFSPRLCKAVFVVDCVRHNELRKVVFAVGCVTCRAASLICAVCGLTTSVSPQYDPWQMTGR